MTYAVRLLKRAEKDLQTLPSQERVKIIRRLAALGENPRPRQSRMLKGPYEGLYRLRAGDFRILYQVKELEVIVIVIRVLHRREAYR